MEISFSYKYSRLNQISDIQYVLRSHGGYYRKMLVAFLADLLLQVVLLVAVINAELSPETERVSENCTNLEFNHTENARVQMQPEESTNRNSRQVPNLFQNKQPGFSTSFLNRLNTHGIAITGNIGLGVRYASGNSYNGDGSLSHQNHRENTNNVYDRYLGTTFNIGTNLHMLNKADDHQSYQHGLAGTRKDDDTAKVLTSDNSTSRQTAWQKIHQYFPKSKFPNVFNGTAIDCGETGGLENCTEETTNNVNILTKFLNKHFYKNEPRKFIDNETSNALEKAFNDEVDHNGTNLFNKVSKYFNRYKFSSIVEQVWNDRGNIVPNNNTSLKIKNDYNSFRNVVRDFLIDRVSSYVSQNKTNENFVQKLIKKALSQMMGNLTTQETKEQLVNETNEKNTLWNYLSEYFNNERFKKFFPDIEAIRNNIGSPQWFDYEGYVNGWLKNNFSHLFTRHSSGNTTKI